MLTCLSFGWIPINQHRCLPMARRVMCVQVVQGSLWVQLLGDAVLLVYTKNMINKQMFIDPFELKDYVEYFTYIELFK